MNKLTSYLKASGTSQATFAVKVGITQGAVSRMAAGTLSPSLSTALLIEKETGGEVRPADLARTVPLDGDRRYA